MISKDLITTRILTKNFDLSVNVCGDQSGERLGLVLPGLLDSKDYDHIRKHIECLSSLGYLAVAFDPPGTWESGGGIGQYSSTHYLEAINEIIDYYGNRPTDVVGHSLGGRMAVVSAALNPHIMSCVSIFSADTFVRQSNEQGRKTEWQQQGTKSFERDLPDDPEQKITFNLPYSFSEDAQQYSAGKSLAGLDKPKMFLAGRFDTIVPEEDVKDVYDAAAGPKEYKVVEAGHYYRFDKDATEKISQLLGSFVIHH